MGLYQTAIYFFFLILLLLLIVRLALEEIYQSEYVLHELQNTCVCLEVKVNKEKPTLHRGVWPLSHPWCTGNSHQHAWFLISTHVSSVEEPVHISTWHSSLSSLVLKLTWVPLQSVGVIDQGKIQSSFPRFWNIDQNSVPRWIHGLFLYSFGGVVLTSFQVLHCGCWHSGQGVNPRLQAATAESESVWNQVTKLSQTEKGLRSEKL